MPLVGSVAGDPGGVAVVTTDANTITLWLESGDTTDLTVRTPSAWPGC